MIGDAWLRALHLIAVIAWMAGLFYLPRLFVYHRETAPKSDSSETFKIMERRLLRAIMVPAMIGSWGFGLALGWASGAFGAIQAWLVIKGLAVVGMTIYQFWLANFVEEFAHDERPRTQRFFRVINEIPTLLMIVIVIMAVVKPV